LCSSMLHFSLILYLCLFFLHSFPTRRSSDLRTICVARLLGRDSAWNILGKNQYQMDKNYNIQRHQYFPGDSESGTPGNDCQECRSEEHTSELQSRFDLVCRLLLEKKKTKDSY